MSFGRRLIAAAVLPAAATSWCAMANAQAAAAGASEFANASIIVEQNATDGDTEIVIAVKGGDEGLRHLSVQAPNGKEVLRVDSSDATTLGLRQFAFESPEPEGEEILAAYPEGVYLFKGSTHSGERFAGQASLSHALPAPAAIQVPASEAVVSPDALEIQWSPAPGAAEYILEFENESADPEQTFTVNLPADVTSFVVPPSLLVAGGDYQIGIATVGSNGNVVVVEAEFSTADK